MSVISERELISVIFVLLVKISFLIFKFPRHATLVNFLQCDKSNSSISMPANKQVEVKSASFENKDGRKVKLSIGAKFNSLDQQVKLLCTDGVSGFRISYSYKNINNIELQVLAHIL